MADMETSQAHTPAASKKRGVGGARVDRAHVLGSPPVHAGPSLAADVGGTRDEGGGSPRHQEPEALASTTAPPIDAASREVVRRQARSLARHLRAGRDQARRELAELTAREAAHDEQLRQAQAWSDATRRILARERREFEEERTRRAGELERREREAAERLASAARSEEAARERLAKADELCCVALAAAGEANRGLAPTALARLADEVRRELAASRRAEEKALDERRAELEALGQRLAGDLAELRRIKAWIELRAPRA